MNDLKTYIENLELSETDDVFPYPGRDSASYEVQEASESETAVLNFKSLLSFAAGVSGQHQEDLLNSLLLAQRAAEKSFPGDDQIMEWYQQYFEILDRLGWVIEKKDFVTFHSQKSVFEIENALLEILSTAISGTQLAIIMKSIQSLKSLGEEDKRFAAFEKNTHSLQQGSFQLGIATEVNGNLAVSGYAFILRTNKDIKRILFFKSGKDSTEFKFCNINATLNDSIFIDARKIIREKLGDTSSFVADLEL